MLYIPLDVSAAYCAFGATCGPAALAAVLQRPILDLETVFRRHGYAKRGYCSPTHMKQVLWDIQMPFVVTTAITYGLLFVQFTGPWTQPGKPVKEAYKHTHWVGFSATGLGRPAYYDINAKNPAGIWGYWLHVDLWEQQLLPEITKEIPDADGKYFIRWGCEVQLPDDYDTQRRIPLP